MEFSRDQSKFGAISTYARYIIPNEMGESNNFQPNKNARQASLCILSKVKGSPNSSSNYITILLGNNGGR